MTTFQPLDATVALERVRYMQSKKPKPNPELLGQPAPDPIPLVRSIMTPLKATKPLAAKLSSRPSTRAAATAVADADADGDRERERDYEARQAGGGARRERGDRGDDYDDFRHPQIQPDRAAAYAAGVQDARRQNIQARRFG